MWGPGFYVRPDYHHTQLQPKTVQNRKEIQGRYLNIHLICSQWLTRARKQTAVSFYSLMFLFSSSPPQETRPLKVAWRSSPFGEERVWEELFWQPLCHHHWGAGPHGWGMSWTAAANCAKLFAFSVLCHSVTNIFCIIQLENECLSWYFNFEYLYLLSSEIDGGGSRDGRSRQVRFIAKAIKAAVQSIPSTQFRSTNHACLDPPWCFLWRVFYWVIGGSPV